MTNLTKQYLATKTKDEQIEILLRINDDLCAMSHKLIMQLRSMGFDVNYLLKERS